jgi:hypothetical protein
VLQKCGRISYISFVCQLVLTHVHVSLYADFVITAEAFFLMHHVRTFPYVNYKHNLIEALGHQALMLMYAIALVVRNDDEVMW